MSRHLEDRDYYIHTLTTIGWHLYQILHQPSLRESAYLSGRFNPIAMLAWRNGWGKRESQIWAQTWAKVPQEFVIPLETVSNTPCPRQQVLPFLLNTEEFDRAWQSTQEYTDKTLARFTYAPLQQLQLSEACRQLQDTRDLLKETKSGLQNMTTKETLLRRQYESSKAIASRELAWSRETAERERKQANDWHFKFEAEKQKCSIERCRADWLDKERRDGLVALEKCNEQYEEMEEVWARRVRVLIQFLGERGKELEAATRECDLEKTRRISLESALQEKSRKLAMMEGMSHALNDIFGEKKI